MSVHELFAYLRVRNAGAAIDFYARAFGATEKFRLTEPGGRIGHVELLFGEHTVMLSEEFPELGLVGPESLGGVDPPARRRLRRLDRACGRRGSDAGARSERSVLRRALRDGARSLRSRVDDRPRDREGVAGRDAASIRRDDEGLIGAQRGPIRGASVPSEPRGAEPRALTAQSRGSHHELASWSSCALRLWRRP